jgi:pyruvate/2-oxoglutarate dehydrogenase complex dihydrolipoamide acyltransferase (E2) component
MAQDIQLPDLGEGIESADVVNILVAEGDTIEVDQSIVEIETDKATVEVPASSAGKVVSIDVEVGQTVKVGEKLISVEGGGESTSDQDAQASKPQDADKTRDKPKPKAEEQPPDGEESDAEASQPDREADPTRSQAQGKAESQDEQEDEEGGEPGRSEGQPDATSSSGGAAPGGPEAGRPDKVIPAGPATRRMARELGIDLGQVSGSGPGGRIETEDVRRAVRELASKAKAGRGGAPIGAGEQGGTITAPAGEPGEDDHGPVRREKMPKIRQTIARRMAESASTIPHVTHVDEADVTDLDALRKQHKESFAERGLKLTMLPLVARAVIGALRKNPIVNAQIDMDAKEVIYKEYVHLGIAVDTDRGLLVPVIRNADRMGVLQLTGAIQQTAERVRDNDFELADLQGGSFTISNVGAVGGWFVTPKSTRPRRRSCCWGVTSPSPSSPATAWSPRGRSCP